MAIASSMPLGVLRESGKIFTKNGKLIACITVLSLLLNSFIYLLNFYSTKPLIDDVVIKLLTLIRTSSSSHDELAKLVTELEEALVVFIEVESIYFLVNFIVFAVLASLTIFASFAKNKAIFASASILAGNDFMASKDLVLKAVRSYKKPFLTWLCSYLYVLGYLFLVLASLVPLGLIMDPPDAASIATIAIIVLLASVFFIYISVTWTLALIVSVLEEIRGFGAIGKTSQIAKGIMILSCLLVQGVRLIQFQQPSMVIQITVALLLTAYASLINMFWLMACTQCNTTSATRIMEKKLNSPAHSASQFKDNIV